MLGVGGGLTLPDLFRLQAKAEETGRGAAPETSVIFVWLPGGPPHLDMYDMKPNVSSENIGQVVLTSAFHQIVTMQWVDWCCLIASFAPPESIAHHNST